MKRAACMALLAGTLLMGQAKADAAADLVAMGWPECTQPAASLSPLQIDNCRERLREIRKFNELLYRERATAQHSNQR